MPQTMQLLVAGILVSALFPIQAAGRTALRHLQQAHHLKDDGGDTDSPKQSSTQEAIRRLGAVEDLRTSQVLCRLAGSEDGSYATVRLQPRTNTRSLVFGDDFSGVETRVRCEGPPDPQCTARQQSGVAKSIDECAKCPCPQSTGETFGAYAAGMAAEVDKRCKGGSGSSDSALRVLLLGFGAGELAARIVKSCPAVDLEAVELDGRLPVLAQAYFGLSSAVHVTVGDAGPVAHSLREQIESNQLLASANRFDVVLVDCFSSGGVTPEHCRSAGFVDDVHKLLRDGGVVVHHMWHQDPQHQEVAEDFTNTVELYKKAFQCKGCGVNVQALQGGPDSLLLASVMPGTDSE